MPNPAKIYYNKGKRSSGEYLDAKCFRECNRLRQIDFCTLEVSEREIELVENTAAQITSFKGCATDIGAGKIAVAENRLVKFTFSQRSTRKIGITDFFTGQITFSTSSVIRQSPRSIRMAVCCGRFKGSAGHLAVVKLSGKAIRIQKAAIDKDTPYRFHAVKISTMEPTVFKPAAFQPDSRKIRAVKTGIG